MARPLSIGDVEIFNGNHLAGVERDHQIVTAAGEIGDIGSLNLKLNDRGVAQRNLGAF